MDASMDELDMAPYRGGRMIPLPPDRVPPPPRSPITRRVLRMTYYVMCGVAVGIVGGIGAFVFRKMIAFFHNILFLGTFSLSFDTLVHTDPAPWGVAVIFVPVIGAAGVSFLVNTFASEAKGHGVPEVMDSIHYNRGQIRPIVALVKIVASSLSIGSGGSVGREGPIIQIGCTFGSCLRHLSKLHHRLTLRDGWVINLVAAGGAAGISATFNAPLGGILFAIELLMLRINVGNLFVVSAATIVATFIGQALLGPNPAFQIASIQRFTNQEVGWDVLWFIPLGCIIGVLSMVFIRMLYFMEDLFEHQLGGNYYTRHLGGMAIMGVSILLLHRYTGYYYIEGVGYAAIMDILCQRLTNIGLLLFLSFLKLAATALTIGSGASGGIFSPSLFMGACTGAWFAGVVSLVVPGTENDLSIPAYAVAGMSAFVSATTGAMFTSAVMCFEMTENYYKALLPLMICSCCALLTRRMICTVSIYTLKLRRRGHFVHDQLVAAFLQDTDAGSLMRSDPPVRRLEEGVLFETCPLCTVLITPERGREIVVGWLPPHTDELDFDQATDKMQTTFLLASEEERVMVLMRRMQASDVRFVVVMKTRSEPSLRASRTAASVSGYIGTEEVAEEMLRQFSIM